ncbi:MAG: alkaline phosphatase family protein [Verrucomicrobiia bacterium]
MRPLSIVLAVLLSAAAATTFAAGKAEHVVMVVWDGMRPDFVTESNTPTLYQLARDGVFFQNHHAVYLSSTEVNATAMATGSYPNRNGILGNREYRPNIDPLKRIEVQSLEVVRKGDELTGNHYLHLPTIAEILQRAGKRTAIAGTKPVVILFDRLESGRPCGDCIDLFNFKTVPASAIDRLGLPPFTPQESPNTRQDQATTQALIGPMWDKEVPPFSLLWLSEPDYAQHSTGPGSVISLKAVRGSDDNLARVLKELTARGIRDKTDIFVVSDHGFSTISRVVSVTDTLNKAGFHAAHEFQQPPNDGDVMVVGNGGTALLYVIGHDRQLVKNIVALLQQQDFTGVIFTREPMNGTFTLDQVRINTPDAPDIAVSFRWTNDKNDVGVPGSIPTDGFFGARQGIHSSLSPFDMRNTLVAAGPDFRRGWIDELPSGNVDLAPTILQLLGVSPPDKMDGRVLTEAMLPGPTKLTPIEMRTLDTSCDSSNTVWHQSLHVTEFCGTTYFDEGNGYSAPKR